MIKLNRKYHLGYDGDIPRDIIYPNQDYDVIAWLEFVVGPQLDQGLIDIQFEPGDDGNVEEWVLEICHEIDKNHLYSSKSIYTFILEYLAAKGRIEWVD